MILCIANQKGGSGKTATAAAIAQAASFAGESVLAIDLDPQGNLSYALGASEGQGSYELMTAGIPARKLIQERQGISIIASSRNLAAVTAEAGSARRLEEALKGPRTQYSLIVIDTPPTAGILQYSGLQAATDLLIPLQAETFSLQGLYQIVDTAKLFRQTNPDLRIAGVVITRYDGRSTLSRQMADAIQTAGERLNIPYLGTIREGIAIKEAQALQQNMFLYAPRAKAVQEYMDLYMRIMKEHAEQVSQATPLDI